MEDWSAMANVDDTAVLNARYNQLLHIRLRLQNGQCIRSVPPIEEPYYPQSDLMSAPASALPFHAPFSTTVSLR